ncbi:MAG: NAD(P)H-hydrate dehydratase [Proteobacteria bacterium]|nr:NAD(P)H-hydrate dehydratase [Pseudomonadota bacterium]
MKNLPDNLYSVDSVVRLEQVAINQFGIPAYELMKRAGEAVFQVLKTNYPQQKKVLVLCGAGNNAGDGYVVARLAKQAGFDVSVISLIDPAALKNEALLAYHDWQSIAENTAANKSLIDETDIIIDALLGTGLTREVSAEWSDWITAVNRSARPVIAIDVPSGLIADTGVIAGNAIQADQTVCFIGLKQGMFTAQAKDVCGEIVFDDLALPDEVYSLVGADARLVKSIDYSILPKRKPSSNKGNFGHVLIVGGNTGMPGAVILAAKAALRTGAGLVTILTVASNLEAISSAVPEAMVKSCDENSIIEILTASFIKNVTHVAIGMGLGQDGWSLALLRFCAQLNKPILIDADALNLIARQDITIKSCLVVTPHPGEAARLLSDEIALSSTEIQKDRFAAAKRLYDLFRDSETCVVILKGSGTIVFDGHTVKICSLGNAAMAAPGMGDVLSGIVIALMAQGINISAAAELAVCLHASAAQSVTQDRTRGLLASDVISELVNVLQ